MRHRTPEVNPYLGNTSYGLPAAGLVLGLLGAGLALHLGQRVGTDASSYWLATRALLHGGNPYTAANTDWPAFYPLPAYLVLLPLALLPAPAFHIVLAGLAGLALGVAATRRPALAPALLSAGFFACMANGPWPVLLLAGVAVPGLAVLWSCKPSLGAALFAGWPRPETAIVGLVVAALGVAILPTWVADWLHNLSLAPHVAPIMRPGGFLLLLALLRWRTPEARLVGLLACMPHTVSVGDALLLFAVCRTRWDAYALAVLSYGAAFWAGAVIDPSMTLVEAQSRVWVPILVGCYLPALALTLRPSSSASSSWWPPSPT